MSTMFSRSLVMIEQSKAALIRVSEDEAFLDIACFDSQQAIEFILKVVLFEYGVRYDRSHNIRYLYDLVKATSFTFDRASDLDLLADTITDWEENSRYGKGVRTTIQTVQRVHNIYWSINHAFLDSQQKNNEKKG